MISSVVGFDIGYSSCFIGIARGGGIEIIDNEYSQRVNPWVNIIITVKYNNYFSWHNRSMDDRLF